MKKRTKPVPTTTDSRPRRNEPAPQPVEGDALREVRGGDGTAGWSGNQGWG